MFAICADGPSRLVCRLAGRVVSFLALALVGLASRDNGTVRAAYVAMEVTAWFEGETTTFKLPLRSEGISLQMERF